MTAATDRGTALLERFRSDILGLLSNAPQHGSCSFTLYLTDGEPTRFEIGATVGKLARPDRGTR